MELIQVETKTTTVAAAFLPVDAFTGDPVTEDLVVKLDGVVSQPIYHPEGYVLFRDLPDAVYSVSVMSPVYELFTPVSVDTATLDPKASAEILTLSPLPDYDFPENTTLLRVTITDQDDLPLCDARVEVTTNNFETFAITDNAGRAVLFFDLSQSSKVLNLTISKDGYNDANENATINLGAEVELAAQLIISTPAAVAQLSGQLTNPAGYYVTQAFVDAPAYGVSGTTDSFGNILLSPVFSQTNENVDLVIDQEGYDQATPTIQGTKGAITNFSVAMNTNILSITTRVRVRVRSGGQSLEDALVEIIEKGRAAYTISNGRMEQYFNDVPPGPGGEFVTIKASKPGYVSRTIVKKIKEGRNHFFTIRLQSI